MVKLFFVISLWLTPSFLCAKQLIVNIDNPNFRKLIVGIPSFITSDPSLKSLADDGSKELGRLLSYSGLFNVIDRAAFKELVPKLKAVQGAKKMEARGLQGIDVVQWRAVGVESLTIGEISKDKSGLILLMRTVDITSGKMVLGKKYRKVKQAELSLVLRRYADQILKTYTGKPGIFSSKIVFIGRKTKQSSKQVYISDFDGSNVIQITKAKSPHVSPTWSTSGKYISYTSFENGKMDIYVYELATGKKTKISRKPGMNSGSHWSPDDRVIAYSGSRKGDTDIYLIDAFGKGKRKLLVRGSGLDVAPAFSPNKKWIAFVSGRYGNPHIFRATLDWKSGTNVKVIADKRLTYAGWYNAAPAWAPESDKIAFAGYDKDIDRFDLFMMNPDGKSLERLDYQGRRQREPFLGSEWTNDCIPYKSPWKSRY